MNLTLAGNFPLSTFSAPSYCQASFSFTLWQFHICWIFIDFCLPISSPMKTFFTVPSPFKYIVYVPPTKLYHGHLQKSWLRSLLLEHGWSQGLDCWRKWHCPFKSINHQQTLKYITQSWRNVVSPNPVWVTRLPWCPKYNAFVMFIREGFTVLLHILCLSCSFPYSMVFPEPVMG